MLAHGLVPSCPAFAGPFPEPLLTGALATLVGAWDEDDPCPEAKVPLRRVVELLLEAGADPFEYDSKGRSCCLWRATSCGDAPLLRKVLHAAAMAICRVCTCAGADKHHADCRATFICRLCEPMPTEVTCRQPAGAVWSPSTARAVRFQSRSTGRTLLQAALHLDNLPFERHLSYAVDEKLAVLLEAAPQAACWLTARSRSPSWRSWQTSYLVPPFFPRRTVCTRSTWSMR